MHVDNHGNTSTAWSAGQLWWDQIRYLHDDVFPTGVTTWLFITAERVACTQPDRGDGDYCTRR